MVAVSSSDGGLVGYAKRLGDRASIKRSYAKRECPCRISSDRTHPISSVGDHLRSHSGRRARTWGWSADARIYHKCRVFEGARVLVAAMAGLAVATFVGNHEGDGSMVLRSMTVHWYEEIRRRLAEGRSLREIARALGCSRPHGARGWVSGDFISIGAQFRLHMPGAVPGIGGEIQSAGL